MNIATEPYRSAASRLPRGGRHVVAHQKDELLVVYQAYQSVTADFAVRHQALGGPAFSYQRMSWIKPSFLWMMYRSRWAERAGQEHVLALWITKQDFLALLADAVVTSFDPRSFDSHEAWTRALRRSAVRVQWDPDRHPSGAAIGRRAIQVGLKGEALARFGTQQIRVVEDITSFVREQKGAFDARDLESLRVPQEAVLAIADAAVARRLGLASDDSRGPHGCRDGEEPGADGA